MSTAEAPAASLRELAENSNAWPFEEARKIVARLKKKPKDEVIFETGYGPSGLPHIGTFGEVARTTMVRHAFRVLTDDKIKTRLIAFSDDMDGLRKVPDNVPNKDMLAHASRQAADAGARSVRNASVVRRSTTTRGCAPSSISSASSTSSCRRPTATSPAASTRRCCCSSQRFDAVMNIMLPSLREERAQTYSPFLPIHPKTGIVMQVPVEPNAAKGTIAWSDPDTGERFETPVTGGHCKLQWKPDWAMRWVALGIDYEMAGKDLIDSVKLSGEIARALGAQPPEGFNYELFLDEKGQKISKSKGNGLTIEEWLRYASPESLSLFMYREPKSAKRLYFDVIPRNCRRLSAVPRRLSAPGREAAAVQSGVAHPFGQSAEGRHAGHVPASADAGVVVERRECRDAVGLHRPLPAGRHAADASEARRDGRLCDQLLSRLRRADEEVPRADRERARGADRSARCAVAICRRTRAPRTSRTSSTRSAGASRSSTHKKPAKDGRPGVSLDWFNMLYQVLLGQEKGPRFGSFVAVYGIAEHGRHDRRRAGAERIGISRNSLLNLPCRMPSR